METDGEMCVTDGKWTGWLRNWRKHFAEFDNYRGFMLFLLFCLILQKKKNGTHWNRWSFCVHSHIYDLFLSGFSCSCHWTYTTAQQTLNHTINATQPHLSSLRVSVVFCFFRNAFRIAFSIGWMDVYVFMRCCVYCFLCIIAKYVKKHVAHNETERERERATL